MDLKSLIQSGVLQARFLVSLHAGRRLRQRNIPLWQIEAGVKDWVVIEERPDDLPNPSIVVEQSLQDGQRFVLFGHGMLTKIKPCWSPSIFLNEVNHEF